MTTRPEALILATKLELHGMPVMAGAAAELRRLHVMEKRYEAIKRMRWSDLEVIKQQPLYGRDFDGHIDAFIAKAKGEKP
jgi:hypothetical protein